MSGLILSKSALGGIIPFSNITVVVHRALSATLLLQKAFKNSAYENSQMDFTMLAKALAPSRWPIFALTDPLQDRQPLNFCGTSRARHGRLPTHKGAPRLNGPSGRLGLWLSSLSDHPLVYRCLAAASSEPFVCNEADGVLAVGLNVASLMQGEARLRVNVADQILLSLGARLR